MVRKLQTRKLGPGRGDPRIIKASGEFWRVLAKQVMNDRLDRGYSKEPEYVVGILQ